jgi:hypothetical protein
LKQGKVITIEDVWIFIYEKGAVRAKDLEVQFLKKEDHALNPKDHLSKGTLYKYKRILEIDKKINMTVIPGVRPLAFEFSVPKKYAEEIEALKAKRRLNSIIDTLNLHDVTKMINVWSELEMVIQNMIKMGYDTKLIKAELSDALEEVHTRLVDRIVKDVK